VAAVSADAPVLAVNSGSSSLKFGLFIPRNGDEVAILKGGADGIGRPDGTLKIGDGDGKSLLDETYSLPTQGHALEEILKAIAKFGGGDPVAVGHRIVHGGPHLREHQRITPELTATLRSAVHFAPLHIPPALALIGETERLLPQTRQYACFDTAFHSTMPPTAFRYGLPEELYRKGVQRYGFHGLSYESVVHRLGNPMPSRVVCAHLGSGASLAALRDGRSVDTSMGMTPTGGIPMATRCGDLDPGILLFLMRTENANADTLETLLNRRSGLTALSGGEADMRQLLAAMNKEKGDAAATLAVQVFVGAVRKFIGAYAAELGGLDLLVFTGGIGEHSGPIRKLICAGLDFLGISGGEPGPGSKVVVMSSEEEAQIARHCRRLMNS